MPSVRRLITAMCPATRQPARSMRLGQSRSEATDETTGSNRVAYRLGHDSAVGQISRAVETVRSYQQRSAVLLSATLVLIGLAADVPEVREGLTAGGCWVALGIGLTVLGIVSAFGGTALLNRPLKGRFEPTARVIVEDYGDDSERFADDDSVYRALALHAGKAAEIAETQCERRTRWMWVCLAAPFLLMAGLTIVGVHG